jgi:hypothetical protein
MQWHVIGQPSRACPRSEPPTLDLTACSPIDLIEKFVIMTELSVMSPDTRLPIRMTRPSHADIKVCGAPRRMEDAPRSQAHPEPEYLSPGQIIIGSAVFHD